LRRGGPGKLELRNILRNFLENWSKKDFRTKFKPNLVPRIFLWEVDLSPHDVNLVFENFFGGGRPKWEGIFLFHPPQPKTTWHGPAEYIIIHTIRTIKEQIKY
jgi:hypothetical protein